MNIIQSFSTLDALIIDRPANIAPLRNLVASIREQYEAEQNSHAQTAQAHAELQNTHAQFQKAHTQEIAALQKAQAEEMAKFAGRQPKVIPQIGIRHGGGFKSQT